MKKVKTIKVGESEVTIYQRFPEDWESWWPRKRTMIFIITTFIEGHKLAYRMEVSDDLFIHCSANPWDIIAETGLRRCQKTYEDFKLTKRIDRGNFYT